MVWTIPRKALYSVESTRQSLTSLLLMVTPLHLTAEETG